MLGVTPTHASVYVRVAAIECRAIRSSDAHHPLSPPAVVTVNSVLLLQYFSPITYRGTAGMCLYSVTGADPTLISALLHSWL